MTTSEVSRVLVVVPARDEQDCIGAVVAEVVAAGLECLVVDDGSTDSTPDIARGAGAEVMALGAPTGVGAALRAGCRYALDQGYECIVRVDADGQHPVDAIPVLLDALDAHDVDMAVGSRFATSTSYRVPLGRRVVLGVVRGTLALRSGHWHTDPTSGFRAVRRPLLDALADHLPDHYLGDTFELSLRAMHSGYRVIEVPVAMRARQGGTSCVSRWAAARHTLRSLARAAQSTHPLPSPDRDQPASAGRLTLRTAHAETSAPAVVATCATTW